MDKKELYFMVFIIIILIFGFYLAFYTAVFESQKVKNEFGFENKIDVDTSFIDNCESLDTLNLINNCKLEKMDCNGDDVCNTLKASYYLDDSYCLNIEDESKLFSCIGLVTSYSIFEESVLKDDITICDKFASESGVKSCNDNYYYSKRVNLNDVNFCSNIFNEVMKNECYK